MAGSETAGDVESRLAGSALISLARSLALTFAAPSSQVEAVSASLTSLDVNGDLDANVDRRLHLAKVIGQATLGWSSLPSGQPARGILAPIGGKAIRASCASLRAVGL